MGKYLWRRMKEGIGDGNAVVTGRDAADDAGYRFDTIGKSWRIPVDCDGTRLVEFVPPNR